MLASFFEALYNKVIVSIVVKRSSCDVYMELFSKKGTVSEVSKSFEVTVLTEEMIEYINSYTKESPFFYIAILDMSIDQGAIPTCEKNGLPLYYDISASEYKCMENKWIYYTSKSDLYEIEKNYRKIGLDFIFSPFPLLCSFFKDKIKTHMAMYILIQDSFISLTVFENSQLLYADHLDLETADEGDDELLSQAMSDEDEVDLSSEGIDLDDVDAIEDMEDLDDFGDIEDLDSIEEINEFSDSKDVEEELYKANEIVVESDEPAFNEDYQRFSLIQSSLGHYYKDSKYDGKFIENVYIADGVGVSGDLKHYLEEEMFLNVYQRRIDISSYLSTLVKEELGL